MCIPTRGSVLKVLKTGSLCRVTLPQFEGKLALGVVTSLQVLYLSNESPYVIVWVEMLLEGRSRPFEPEHLEVMPRIQNGFDHAFQFDLMKAAA